MTKHEGPHRYVRIKIGKNKRILFKCSLPTCPHTLIPEKLEGRESLCNKCGKPFIITKSNVKQAKPNCGCGNVKLKSIEEFLKERLG